MVVELDERFWSKVDKFGPIPEHDPSLGNCWVWTAADRGNGYGAYKAQGKVHSPHRLVFLAEVDANVGDRDVDHRCYNRACVRASHLRAATRSENMQNRPSANAGSRTGYRGVGYRRGVYHARANTEGVYTHIGGGFATAELANEAAIEWRRENMPYSLMDCAA